MPEENCIPEAEGRRADRRFRKMRGPMVGADNIRRFLVLQEAGHRHGIQGNASLAGSEDRQVNVQRHGEHFMGADLGKTRDGLNFARRIGVSSGEVLVLEEMWGVQYSGERLSVGKRAQ